MRLNLSKHRSSSTRFLFHVHRLENLMLFSYVHLLYKLERVSFCINLQRRVTLLLVHHSKHGAWKLFIVNTRSLFLVHRSQYMKALHCSSIGYFSSWIHRLENLMRVSYVHLLYKLERVSFCRYLNEMGFMRLYKRTLYSSIR